MNLKELRQLAGDDVAQDAMDNLAEELALTRNRLTSLIQEAGLAASFLRDLQEEKFPIGAAPINATRSALLGLHSFLLFRRPFLHARKGRTAKGIAMPELLNEPLNQCPMCLQPVSDYSEVRTDRPFTACNPFEGLNAWGAYSIPKQTLCFKGGQIIHFKIGDSERIVRMLTAPEIPKCFDCGATEIADVCPECFKPFCANCVEKDENCCDK